MIRIKKDWWKDFFGHIYLITDARSVCDNKLTSKEVDLLENMLGLKKNDNILDLFGGQARHSIELAKRGYRNLTLVDYSNYLLHLGRTRAKKAKLNIKFHCQDVRRTKLCGNNYSAIIVMANSFGYFPAEKENLKVLKEINRLLTERGKILLDLTNASYIKSRLEPISWHRIGKDIKVFRARQITKDLVKTREVVISKKKGLLQNRHYCERIYSKEKIRRMLKISGFKNIEVKSSPSLHKKKQDYGFLTSRMFVTASK